jgi:hypothetical protein
MAGIEQLGLQDGPVQTHAGIVVDTAIPFTVVLSGTNETVHVMVRVGKLPSGPIAVPMRGIKAGSPGRGNICEVGMQPAMPPKAFGSGGGHPLSATGAGTSVGSEVFTIHPTEPPKLFRSLGQSSCLFTTIVVRADCLVTPVSTTLAVGFAANRI